MAPQYDICPHGNTYPKKAVIIEIKKIITPVIHVILRMKDLTSLIVIIFLFMVINYLNPFSLIDPENFTPANPLVTPVHIQPE